MRRKWAGGFCLTGVIIMLFMRLSEIQTPRKLEKDQAVVDINEGQ